MIIDMNYWSKVIKKIIIFFLTILGLLISFKFAVFYMPFIIAFIFAQIIEPIIRFLMRKAKFKRKTSSIIVFVIFLTIIILLLIGLIVALISESYNLLNGLNDYLEIISNKFQEISYKMDLSRLNLSEEIRTNLQNSTIDIFNNIIEWLKEVLFNFLKIITSIPTIAIYIGITVLSLYFICTDKIYIIDQLEHHLPRIWVKKIDKFIKIISSSLGSWIKAQAILIFISFCICVIGLYIFKFVGLDIGYPLLAALGIAFVDALPIFGSSAVIIPWAIISGFNGNLRLGIALICLLIVMSITRQMIEPKIVSGQLGIHPIFTLIAMYTGFKFLGVVGLLIGPILLIILKTVFGTMLDKGFAKSIFERE